MIKCRWKNADDKIKIEKLRMENVNDNVIDDKILMRGK